MVEVVSKEIRLKSRPTRVPELANFELAQVQLDPLRPNEILVRNVWMTVDPYMRFQMIDQSKYPKWELGRTLTGFAIGRVIESLSDRFKVGDYVQSTLGWREYFVVNIDAPGDKMLAPHSGGAIVWPLEPNGLPLRAHMGALNITGLSAYVGLINVADIKAGETVFVSSAAGAVGTVACDIAKAMGCVVIGSTGSDEKCAWLKEILNIDHVINYRKAENLRTALGEAAPLGIDVYFDNVGGDHLVAAIASMKTFGRIAICGSISQYNSESPPAGPRNFHLVVPKRLRIEGFESSDRPEMMATFRARMHQWINEGKLHLKDTVVEGIENAPRAFLGLFTGENLGKMLVRLSRE